MKRELKLALVVGIVVALGLMGLMPAAAQQPGITVTRAIAPDEVPAGGGEVTVTITIVGPYGVGSVQETVLGGLSYVDGSVTPSDITPTVDGSKVSFPLVGEQSFSYKVSSSGSAGTVSGKLIYGVDKDEVSVSGEDSVTVEAAQQPGITVTRAIAPDEVPAGGGEVTVTITIVGPYGVGSVQETVLGGLSYVDGSVTPSDITPTVDGSKVSFPLVGEQSFSYKVSSSGSAGTVSGKLIYGVDKDEVTVGGEDSVTVEAAQQPGITVTRAIAPDEVPAGGGEVTVTITIVGPYGVGSVQETVLGGLSYVDGSVTPSDITPTVDGSKVSFPLVGEQSFSYKVSSSGSAGTVSGKLIYGVDKDEVTVGGEDRVTVRTAGTPPPEPSPPPSGNAEPVFTSPATVRVPENTTTVTTVRATDRDSRDRVTGYDRTGGADRDKFQIVRNTGALSFLTAPDFEAPTDADADNQYVVEVTATSGRGSRQRTEDQTITVTVTNGDDPGTVTLAPSQPVTGTALTAMLEDPDGETAMVEWKWASSDAMAGTFTDISGATTASYTPREAVADDPATTDVNETYAGDVGMYLQATAMYNDGHDDDKSAMMVTDNAVITAPADMCITPLGTLSGPETRMGIWADDCASEAKRGSYARYYTFTLGAQTQVEMNLNSSANTYLALREREGRTGELVTSNDDVSSRYTHSSINRMLDAGTYTVEATTVYPRTNDFTLSVRPLTCTENLGALTRSVDRSNSLWVATCASTEREGSYARFYTFTLSEETHVGINLTSAQNTYLYLTGTTTGGVSVDMENDDAPNQRTRNSGIEGDLEAGTYTIEATTLYSGRDGTFHLNIGYFGAPQ